MRAEADWEEAALAKEVTCVGGGDGWDDGGRAGLHMHWRIGGYGDGGGRGAVEEYCITKLWNQTRSGFHQNYEETIVFENRNICIMGN